MQSIMFRECREDNYIIILKLVLGKSILWSKDILSVFCTFQRDRGEKDRNNFNHSVQYTFLVMPLSLLIQQPAMKRQK